MTMANKFKLIVVNGITNEETEVAKFSRHIEASQCGQLLASMAGTSSRLKYYLEYREKGLHRDEIDWYAKFTTHKISIQLAINSGWDNNKPTFHCVMNAPGHAQAIADATGHAVRMTYITEHTSSTDVGRNNGHYFIPKPRVYAEDGERKLADES